MRLLPSLLLVERNIILRCLHCRGVQYRTGIGSDRLVSGRTSSVMPLELVATAPRTPELREYTESPLGPTQIRIASELASPKHGTELVGYRNDPVASRP